MKYFIAAIAVLALVCCAGPKAEEPSVGEQQVNELMDAAKETPVEAPAEEPAKEEAPADSPAEEVPAEE